MAVTEPTKLPRPFAEQGSYETVPDSTTVYGHASWQKGFPSETAMALSEGGVPPRWMDFQGIFHDITEHICYLQKGSHYKYDATVDYPVGAMVVGSNNKLYVSLKESGPTASGSAVNPVSDTNGYWQSFNVTDYLPLSGGTMTGAVTLANGTTLNGKNILTPESTLDATKLSGTASIATTGNAATATKLNTERKINGVSFNGTADITVTDGTKLPLSGGTMTGNINGTQTDTSGYAFGTTDKGVRLKAGEFGYGTMGAYIDLNKSSGEFAIRANTGSSGTNISLTGNVDGTLKWANKDIERVDSSGTGWIRYTSGLQICWGSTGILTANTDTQINFSKNFAVDSNGNGRYSVSAMRNASANVATNSATLKGLKAGYFIIRDSEGGNYRYIAIGPWK